MLAEFYGHMENDGFDSLNIHKSLKGYSFKVQFYKSRSINLFVNYQELKSNFYEMYPTNEIE